MTLRNTPTQYGKITKYLHWLIAILIIGLLIAGFSLDFFKKPLKPILTNVHKEVGLLLLGLLLIRITWYLFEKKPVLPSHMSQLEVILAKSAHSLLLFCTLLMPIIGWALACAAGHPPSFFGFFTANLPITPNDALASTLWNAHKTLAWVIVALVSLHVLAALKHHFINRDDVLKRML